jgi:polyisoprenoid-binding protein YceI
VSRFSVRAFASGALSMFAHSPTIAIRGFTGELELVPGSLDTASLTFAVDARTLTLQDDVKDSDRREIERQMRENVLEVERFPQILFESRQVSATRLDETRYAARVSGRLTLHGVTNDHMIVAQVTFLGTMLRANGEFPILQSQYGIKPVSAVGGTITVKDELKCVFDIVARRGQPSA